MKMRLRPIIVLVAVLLAASIANPSALPAPSPDEEIVHVLNRLAFGPRAGDIERVRALGVKAYIEQQLRPDRIPDNEAVERLAGLRTLGMTSRDIAAQYELPLLRARREQKQQAGAQTGTRAAGPAGTGQSVSGPGGAAEGGTGQAMPPAAPPAAPAPFERQQANLPLAELSQQKILRAIYSERQLQETLTDFWFNHFNVDARKGPERFLITEYEREAIRPHVLGRFRDLLEATAKSQAMLFYLDNWLSADPNGPHGNGSRLPVWSRPGRGATIGVPRPPQQNQKKGLNENYGRELLELHTLGVDGGYTQKDVTEVARSFTGWTITNPRLGGGFRFDPRLHDDGAKVVLGHRLKGGGGMRDGEQVLDILAEHPSTARFIAMKLARRFVADTPPQPLVDRAAKTFRATNGDLRAVLTVLLTSPEFLAPDTLHAKVKTPFEFVVSAVRATGAVVEDARPLVRAVQELGMPLYQCQPPTGYKDTADAWVNTGALINRMNIALALASDNLAGVRLEAHPQPESFLIGTPISDATRTTIARASTPQQAIALTIGSPEFQRR
jgi:uncharacterized protein (DUF1800 family)